MTAPWRDESGTTYSIASLKAAVAWLDDVERWRSLTNFERSVRRSFQNEIDAQVTS